MEAIIKVSHLTKTFRELTAVNDLSFTVQKGDVYGFLGQNGAGKSTSIRMLLTLIQPTSGSIEVFGYNLQHHRKEILRNTGAVIERPDLYKYLSAYETLQLFAAMSSVKLTRQQYMDQLELVGLAQRANSKVRTFSQGMKQRLGIAVALVHNPELIVLDEPTNGLDPQGIADMRNLILMLREKMKKTVLVSSHLLSEVEQIANRMLIIDKGKKLVEGTVSELFHPDDTVVLIETTNQPACEELLRNSNYATQLIGIDAAGIELKLRKEEVPVLTKMLIENNISILGIHACHSLEDYFLKITTANQHVEPFKN
ncbi:ABC transporter ATP-binding protein [Lacibacter luteus]|uniref:ABC transporter ATP-binding protein n=1 Tax=Lacibacter luteus TaxID=2508719 RepID=A0A4Q1CHY7_9BACT|nr:ABC transporter ATP-binding protein [Lacibacter luteus]RXK59973.1 ABC transporter ATP-binding protein [Lacibacter luteus]